MTEMLKWAIGRQNFRSLPIEVSYDRVRLLELIVQFLSLLRHGLVGIVVSRCFWQRLVSRHSEFELTSSPALLHVDQPKTKRPKQLVRMIRESFRFSG
jgi:hypothetical protein